MTDTTTDGEEIVQFSMKKKYRDIAHMAIADAMALNMRTSAEQPVSTPASVIDWTDAAVMAKLRTALNKLPIALTLMEMVAAASIKKVVSPVTFEQIYKATGFPDGQRARSSLGAFTKIIKREFPSHRDKPTWPVVIAYNESGEASYTMNREVAEAWMDAAK